jgi:hypothetical protein
LAAAWDECVKAIAWAMENGLVGHRPAPDPLRYVAEHNPYREDSRLHDSANDGALDARMHEGDR